jgi:hypothetical protein
MSDLKSILAEEYEKQNSEVTVESLMEMVEEVLDELYDTVVVPKVSEAKMKQEQAKQFLLSLPKFSPSEAWGDPNSMERQQIQQIFNVIGGGRSVRGKLEFLQKIADPNSRIRSPRRIISSLIILESLSAVINSFNSSSAGFVFEGFLSALLQGTQEAEISAKGNLPIQDLIAFSDSDKALPISLKLLNQTTQVEGSYTNLVDGLDEFGKMVYIVARKAKDGSGINIEQFTLDKDNFVNALSLSARGSAKGGAGVFQVVDHPELGTLSVNDSLRLLNSISSKDSPEEWQKKYNILQYTRGYSNTVRDKKRRKEEEEALIAAQEKGGIDLDPSTALQESSKGGTQWAISPAQLVSFDFVDYENLGELKYSSEEIEKIASIHMGKLNEELLTLFTATQDLSEHVNEYFTYEKRTKAISSGEAAIQDTVEIQRSLKAQIGDSGEEIE